MNGRMEGLEFNITLALVRTDRQGLLLKCGDGSWISCYVSVSKQNQNFFSAKITPNFSVGS